MNTHPFIKWPGGKSRLLPRLLPLVPVGFTDYYEPFLGGGAMFFALWRRARRAYLGDLNPELLNAWTQVQQHPEALLRGLRRHARQHGTTTREREAHYYAVRSQRPERLGEVARAARFLYLNRTCFNGLYRVNRDGRFNVPMGRYVNPKICDPETIHAAHVALWRGVELTSATYLHTMAHAQRGDFVYCDPPYHPLSSTSSFTGYTANGFSAEDQGCLAEEVARLQRLGVKVMVSNSNTPLVRRLYRGFRIRRIMAARAINSVASKRGPLAELLITNY